MALALGGTRGRMLTMTRSRGRAATLLMKRDYIPIPYFHNIYYFHKNHNIHYFLKNHKILLISEYSINLQKSQYS